MKYIGLTRRSSILSLMQKICGAISQKLALTSPKAGSKQVTTHGIKQLKLPRLFTRHFPHILRITFSRFPGLRKSCHWQHE